MDTVQVRLPTDNVSSVKNISSPSRRKRYAYIGLFLVTFLTLGIFGIVEYTALRRIKFDGVGKIALSDQSVSTTPSLSSVRRRLQTNSYTSVNMDTSSVLRLHASDVGIHYSADISTRLCDCSVALVFPSLDTTVTTPLSVSTPVHFNANADSCITLTRNTASNIFSFTITLDGNDQYVPSAIAYYLTAPSSSSQTLQGSLSCTANLLVIPNIWEPSTTINYTIDIPSFTSSASTTSSSTDNTNSYFVSSSDPNTLLDSSSTANNNGVTSAMFTSLWTGEFDLESVLQSFLQNYLQNKVIPLMETQVSLAGATFMATTDNAPFAAVQIPNINWNWTRSFVDTTVETSNNRITINGGINPSVLSNSVDTSGAIRVAIAAALKGILPSSFQDLVTNTLGTKDISSSPINFYMFAIPNEPNMTSNRLSVNSPTILSSINQPGINNAINNNNHMNRTDTLRQCFQQLDTQVQKGWSTFTMLQHQDNTNTPSNPSSSNVNNNSPNFNTPPSPPFNSLACSPFLSWMRNMFNSLPSNMVSNSNTNMNQNCSTAWVNPMVNIQVTLNTGSTNNIPTNPISSSSSSSFPFRNRNLQTGSFSTVTTSLGVTLVTPDIIADANNMSAILQAQISLTSTNNASFVSMGLARLLNKHIGIWSSLSRVETHISTVWRKAVTDLSGNILRIETPRTSTLWSSLECGAASIAIEPIIGNPGSFTLRGYAHLSQLWSCFNYVSNEYMIGIYANKPLAQRQIAIKPDTAIDQPKGAVRVVFPLLGTISLPMGIASRRWLKGRMITSPAPGEADIEIPNFQSNPDVLPPSALVPHNARVFNNVLVLTDLNCTNSYNDMLETGKCTGGVDGSAGKVARAWAISSHPAANVLDITQYVDLGCATNPSQSPLCNNFENLWRKYGYLGVDGLLLSGECSYGIFDPTRLCLDISFTSDQYGIAVFGLYGYDKQQTIQIDPWNGTDGAIMTKQLTGSVLLRQSNGKPNKLYSAFSGIDSSWLLTWAYQGGISSGWSGVKITAVNMYTWVRQYISSTTDDNVYSDVLGPVPRVNGKACYSPSVGGFDIRYNRDCFFQAILPWTKIVISNDATYVKEKMCSSSLTETLQCLGSKAIVTAVVGPIYGAYDFIRNKVDVFYYTNKHPFGTNSIGGTASDVLTVITALPKTIAYAAVALPILFTSNAYLGDAIYHILRNDLGIRKFNFRTDVSLLQESLGTLTFSSSIENYKLFDAFEAVQTFTTVNNGSAWTALHRILCAMHGDNTMLPADRPFDFTVTGNAGVSGNFGVELMDIPIQNVSTDYTINLHSIIYSLDSLVSRAGLGAFPGWSTDIGFTKPFTDFL